MKGVNMGGEREREREQENMEFDERGEIDER